MAAKRPSRRILSRAPESPHFVRLWCVRHKAWRSDIRETLLGKSGCYIIRDGETREILYVGESHTDRYPFRFWKTLLRHFQECHQKAFEKLGEYQECDVPRERLEVALYVRPADKAQAFEEVLIAEHLPSRNKSAPRAATDEAEPF